MIRNILPYFIQRELFGDRRRYGTTPDRSDPDWKKWLEVYPLFYVQTQRTGSLPVTINNAGYDVLSKVDLSGLAVADIGPGGGYHLDWFVGKPAAYSAIDVEECFFEQIQARAKGFPIQCHMVRANTPRLPLETASQDVLISFYSLEHLNPFEPWMAELSRVLKPGGRLVGAIPAEGGIAWGVGRWLTSRRIMKAKYGLDIRKIICWEHVSFCDTILRRLAAIGSVTEERWPFARMPYDFSLIVKFCVVKSTNSESHVVAQDAKNGMSNQEDSN